MRKEILRGFTMLMLVVAVAFMTAVTSASGQSPTIVADIPFEFNVGDSALPAGRYRVRAVTSVGNTLAFQNRQANKAAIRLTNSIEARKAPKEAKLVFHRYGQRYFLSEVWSSGEIAGRQLLKSRQERAIERQLAAIPAKSDLARSSYEVVEIVAMVR
jgi:hypothetical protein